MKCPRPEEQIWFWKLKHTVDLCQGENSSLGQPLAPGCILSMPSIVDISVIFHTGRISDRKLERRETVSTELVLKQNPNSAFGGSSHVTLGRCHTWRGALWDGRVLSFDCRGSSVWSRMARLCAMDDFDLNALSVLIRSCPLSFLPLSSQGREYCGYGKPQTRSRCVARVGGGKR